MVPKCLLVKSYLIQKSIDSVCENKKKKIKKKKNKKIKKNKKKKKKNENKIKKRFKSL